MNQPGVTRSFFAAASILTTAVLLAGCPRESAAPSSSRTARVKKVAVPTDARSAKVSQMVDVTTPAFFVDSVRLGPSVGKDGVVDRDAITFKHTEPVFLSMKLLQSPSGLVTSAQWFGPDGRITQYDTHEMKGAKTATFQLRGKGLKTGKYHVQAYWGGNLVVDRWFDLM